VLFVELRYNAFLSRTSFDKVLLSELGMKVKVIRLESRVGLNDKVLLSAECRICEDVMEFRDRTFFYLLEMGPSASEMDYNMLKIRVLSLFEASGELDSEKVRTHLLGSKIELSDKAVEMALLRYFRQGLLSRTRRSGRFQYRMTEKGFARRIWLSKAR
jgi:hypothetical protein